MLSLGACQESPQTSSSETAMNDYAADPHSYAQPQEAQVKKLHWEAEIDFDAQRIAATAYWDIAVLGAETSEIIFDTYDLQIEEVRVDGAVVDYKWGASDPELGRALHIPVEASSQKVAIQYRTGADARALQWLAPEQTAGKERPFLFTQSQAILARSWVPCQDSPGIRFSYSADLKVPTGMIALMSAENPQERSQDGRYHFEMPQAIPAYLLALAVGDVYFEAISERAGVYAEKALLDTAVYEFADLEKMILAAEDLYGPYAWGRYDLIVLPPSFPFGGMENPRLTFATPSILAGDRSLVSLVAHELAHSWSGNLVTNATWNDFWLNEGFTVYFEQRIMEALYGRDYAEMLASLTRAGLVDFAAEMMEIKPEDTRLKLDLEGRNPDDGVTSIPYDKGYFFLRLIEEEVGRERFDQFLKNYFAEYKFKVMTTENFLSHLQSELLDSSQYQALRLEQWVYQSGLPDNLPQVESDRFKAVSAALDQYWENGQWPAAAQTDAWSTHEWLHFIKALPNDITAEQLAAIDAQYQFSQSGNSEILAAWFQPTLRAHYQPIYPVVEDFLIRVGRRKFLTPTYRTMLESGQAEMAQRIYSLARPNYHAVSRQTMDDLLATAEEAS